MVTAVGESLPALRVPSEGGRGVHGIDGRQERGGVPFSSTQAVREHPSRIEP